MKRRPKVTKALAKIWEDLPASKRPQPSFRIDPNNLPPSLPQKLRWQMLSIAIKKVGECRGDKKALVHLAPHGISVAHPKRCLVTLIRTDWGTIEPVIIVDPRYYAISERSDEALLSTARALELNLSPEPYTAM